MLNNDSSDILQVQRQQHYSHQLQPGSNLVPHYLKAQNAQIDNQQNGVKNMEMSFCEQLRRNCTKQKEIIDFITQSQAFNIYVNQNYATIQILSLKSDMKIKRFQGQIKLGKDSPNDSSSYFSSSEEIKNFFKCPNNFRIDLRKKCIFIVWKMTAEQYEKKMQTRIFLQEKNLNLVEGLELTIIFMQKKINALQSGNLIQSSKPQTIKGDNQMQQQIDQNKSKKDYSYQYKLKLQQAKILKQRLKAIGKPANNQKNARVQIYDLESPKPVKRRGRKKVQKPQINQSQKSFKIEVENSRAKKVQILDKSEEKYQTRNIKKFSSFPCSYQCVRVGDRVRLDFQNGDYYFGCLNGSIYHGEGKYYTKQTGETLICTWKNGRAEGKGQIFDQEGNRYVGQIRDNQRDGFGVETFKNGQKYQGNHYRNYKQGDGKYYFFNGDEYEGKWEKDMCHGKGKQTYKDGSYYEGFWFNDEKHGLGILYRNGQKLKQKWSYGVLKSQKLLNAKQIQNKSNLI